MYILVVNARGGADTSQPGASRVSPPVGLQPAVAAPLYPCPTPTLGDDNRLASPLAVPFSLAPAPRGDTSILVPLLLPLLLLLRLSALPPFRCFLAGLDVIWRAHMTAPTAKHICSKTAARSRAPVSQNGSPPGSPADRTSPSLTPPTPDL